MTFTRFVVTPESRAAWLAIEAVAEQIEQGIGQHGPGILFLHGPPGCGKTLLVNILRDKLPTYEPACFNTVLDLADPGSWTTSKDASEECSGSDDRLFEGSRLLIVEDLQRICRSRSRTAVRLQQALAGLLDVEIPGRVVVFTATAGPGQLGLEARLANRLAAGLVVAIPPLSSASRLIVLETFAQRRRLAVEPGVLHTLASQIRGSVRELEALIGRLEAVYRSQGRPVDQATAVAVAAEEVRYSRPTLERIARTVSSRLGIGLRDLCSRSRSTNALRARQMAMFLARQLTGHRLVEIGRYFGGRDHSTVLHAVDKIRSALKYSPALSADLNEMEAVLG